METFEGHWADPNGYLLLHELMRKHLNCPIPHDQLNCRIGILICMSFSHGNNKYINVSCNREFFTLNLIKQTWLCHMD